MNIALRILDFILILLMIISIPVFYISNHSSFEALFFASAAAIYAKLIFITNLLDKEPKGD